MRFLQPAHPAMIVKCQLENKECRFLALQQYWFDQHRVTQNIQDKAWVASNGYSLVKPHNAVLDALRCAPLRASHEGVIHVIVPFGKKTTISCKLCLVSKR
jgi:hypothetical protein